MESVPFTENKLTWNYEELWNHSKLKLLTKIESVLHSFHSTMKVKWITFSQTKFFSFSFPHFYYFCFNSHIVNVASPLPKEFFSSAPVLRYKINCEEGSLNDTENLLSVLMLGLAWKPVTLCYITSVLCFPLLCSTNLCPVLLRKCPYSLSKTLRLNNLAYWFELVQNVAEVMAEIRPK